jgi:histidyl-tRNA synthetase
LPSSWARYVPLRCIKVRQFTDTGYQDELAQGKAKLKEMGLPEDHPLKEGELIDLDKLVEEVQARIARKQQLDGITAQAEGLKVVDGVKGEEVKAAAEAA